MAFETWQEREALIEQYGEFYVEQLEWVLGLVHADAGKQGIVKARFKELMHEHVPECNARVKEYEARVRAEEAKKNLAAAAYEKFRQERAADEIVRIEAAAAERTEHYREKCLQEERERAERRDDLEREERARIEQRAQRRKLTREEVI